MKHPRLLVYIAAPFTPTDRQKARRASASEPNFAYLDAVAENKEHASALGLEVARLGAMPIVPHTAHGGRPELEQVQDYLYWIEATAELLFRCDAALFSSNWRESKGAIGEHAKCLGWGIPIFYSVASLQWWMQAKDSIVEDEAILSLHMRLTDRLHSDDPIPYRLGSELPTPSKHPPIDPEFGKLLLPPLAARDEIDDA